MKGAVGTVPSWISRDRGLQKGCILVGIITAAWFAYVAIAQPPGFRRSRGRDWQGVGRGDVPSWEIDRKFQKDSFTFVRI